MRMRNNNSQIINHDDIKLIVYDFDGVMTDNKVIVDETGRESVVVNRSDGYAIARIKDYGISQIILSTEKNQVVRKRAEKLNIPVIHGVDDKKSILEKYCIDHNISLEKVLYIGNDLNDYDVMMGVGYPCCPADAEIEIQDIASWISTKKGGDGVIRELYRVIFGGVKNG